MLDFILARTSELRAILDSAGRQRNIRAVFCANKASQSEPLLDAFTHGKGIVKAMLPIATIAICAVILAASLSLSAQAGPNDDARARKFIGEHEGRSRPLATAGNL